MAAVCMVALLALVSIEEDGQNCHVINYSCIKMSNGLALGMMAPLLVC